MMRTRAIGRSAAAVVFFGSLCVCDPAKGQACGNPHVSQALLDLLPESASAVTAVANGAWSDPATWGGTVPGVGDDVRIPLGVEVVFDVFDDGDGVGPDTTRVGVVRVDGLLRWMTDRDTRLYVDTLFNSTTGVIEIGSDVAPIEASVSAEIVIIADRAMPPADVSQLSRGFIPHGTHRVVGADKTDFVALAGDALAGSTSLELASPAVGWNVGDVLVVGGTWFDPNGDDADNSMFHDDVVTVTSIDGATVGVTPLEWDHVRPDGASFDPSDLRIYVANLTRNVTFRSELSAGSPDVPSVGALQDRRRGHAMVMHTNDSIVRHAAFVDFGRLNKNGFIDDPGINTDGTTGTGSNKRGRYAFHHHRNLPQGAPIGDIASCAPAEVTGCVVWGSPGWGFVHHDSYSVFEDNVAFDVLGSAFVQEAGNEIGVWRRNISIKTTGDDDPDLTVEPFGDGFKRVTNFDFGFNGEAYWIQGASQVEFIDNVAISAAGGGVNIFSDVDGNSNRDRGSVWRSHLPADVRHIVTSGDAIAGNRVPANTFRGFEVVNSDFGLITWNHMRNQGEWIGFTCPCDGNVHREYATVEDFVFWNIYGQGVHLQYSSQIEFRNGLVASSDLATAGIDDKPSVNLSINGDGRGFGFGMNGPTKRLVLEDVAVEGWSFGVRTPLEGQINALDVGLNTGSEGARGLPSRRSIFRNLTLANNTNNFYRRQNGFTVTQGPPNFLVIDGGTFEIPSENAAPVADFTFESVGDVGVVRLSGLASRDSDTPGEGLLARDPASVFVNDANYIVAYAWDFDGDGETDAYGETVTTSLPLGVDTPITLTVWDHQGATASITRDVRPLRSTYDNVLVDGSFDGVFQGGIYALTSAAASTGWWDARGTLTDGRAVLRGQYRFSSVAQAVYDAYATRGVQRLSFDLESVEGDVNPNDANQLTVRVFGVNGEFGSDHAGAYAEPEGAIPVAITPLFQEVFTGAIAPTRVSREIDFGLEGFEYVYVGFAGADVSNQIPNDYVAIDNVELVGASVGTDITTDGLVNLADLLAYLQLYFGGDSRADLDGLTGLTVADLLTYLACWFPLSGGGVCA